MDWTTVAGIVLGYAGQWLKAFKKLSTPVAQLIIAALAVGLYSLEARPTWGTQWFTEAVKFALAALGVSSITAAVKAAPPTDSIH